MDFFDRKFKKDNIEVKICVDEGWTFDNYKSGDATVVFKVIVKEDKKEIEHYIFEMEEITLNKFNNIIKNILENPEYRKTLNSFPDNYNSIWTIPYASDTGMNVECMRMINKINSMPMSRLRFKDFVNLKTFGRDKFSSIKMEKLKLLLGSADIEKIKREFKEEENIITALRWLARGLKLEYVIRKVKTDIEVNENAKSKYK